MANTFPQNNYSAGWPEQLVDTDGNRYVRVRDGSPTGAFSGNSCLYARVGADNAISQDYLYVPQLGSTPDSVRMASGSWLSAEAAAHFGVPPIKLPAAPLAAAGTRARAVPRSLPQQNYDAGWPKSLKDSGGIQYVLVRDGSRTGAFSGHSCLYARIDDRGMILRESQYIPMLGSNLDAVSMAGGAWLSPEAAQSQGLPPISLPSEPVKL